MPGSDPLIIRRARELWAWSDRQRAEGRTIGLVPTMGALHDGHLSLVRLARSRADRVVVSIFVNPTQFGPGEDYQRYPRQLEKDVEYLRRVGADAVFAPAVSEMYPEGDQTRVETGCVSGSLRGGVTEGLCGRSRPGHFAGVTNVVARLFNAAKPHIAVFGEKDYQQLVAIRRMVRDLLLDIEVVGAPTVREPDGLATSSRNTYLSPTARSQARALNAGLHEARQLFCAGERDARRLVGVVRRRIEKEPLAQVDYVELRCAETLAEVHVVDRPCVVAVAVRFDGARLIDNTLLHPDLARSEGRRGLVDGESRLR